VPRSSSVLVERLRSVVSKVGQPEVVQRSDSRRNPSSAVVGADDKGANGRIASLEAAFMQLLCTRP
jgi:hypothetical protein